MAADVAEEGAYNNNQIVSTGDENGVVIKGLEPASYVLIEDVAPTSGNYNLLTEAMRFEIRDLDYKTVTVDDTETALLDLTQNASLLASVDKAKALAGFVSATPLKEDDVTSGNVTFAVYTGDTYTFDDASTTQYYQGYPTGVYKINVKNYEGITLPSTGGMGTLLFTIIGIVLMTGAIILVIMKQRKTSYL